MEINIDKNEVLNYLGKKQGMILDAATSAILDECIREIGAIAAPKTTYRIFELENDENGLRLAGTDVILLGRNIASHLVGCSKCAVMSATLGIGIDREISRLRFSSVTKSVIFDACASAMIEALCDTCDAELKEKYHKITSRFSPGYGDLPIETQRNILALTDAPRRIGLTLTDSFMLTPVKSVTAFIGIE